MALFVYIQQPDGEMSFTMEYWGEWILVRHHFVNIMGLYLLDIVGCYAFYILVHNFFFIKALYGVRVC